VSWLWLLLCDVVVDVVVVVVMVDVVMGVLYLVVSGFSCGFDGYQGLFPWE